MVIIQGRMLTGFARGAVTGPKPGPSKIGVPKTPRMGYMDEEIRNVLQFPMKISLFDLLICINCA